MGFIMTLLKVAVAATVGALVAVPLVNVVLGAIGFSAIGPVASTAAAAWQASIGNVGAGSLFAAFQSIAMGGTLTSTVSAVGAGIFGSISLFFKP